MRISRVLPFVLLLSTAPVAAQGQSDAYLDPAARDLVMRAREAQGRLGREIESYEAVIYDRMGVRLRVPLRDRLLARQETAMRVRWTRGGTPLVQTLAGRAENLGEAASVPTPELDVIFDPDADRFYFGIDLGLGATRPDSAAPVDVDRDGDADSTSVSISIGSGGIDAEIEGEENLEGFWVAHPIAAGSEEFYRYRSGDTLSLRLPTGRTVRMVEVNAIPRVASFNHLRASLWIEPETGALVRAIFRPARDLDIQRDTAFIDAEDVDDLNVIPGMLRPIVVDFGLITIEYSLWQQQHWLPYRMSMEGYVRAGVLRVPFEKETSYRFEQVNDGGVERTMEEVIAEWRAEGAELVLDSITFDSTTVLTLMPRDSAALLDNDELPPPIWEDAPEFASSEEMEELGRRLYEAVPGLTPMARPTFDINYLLGGRGLIRYNRVEALSLGVRGVVDHPFGRGYATVRLGTADLHPSVELGALVPRPAGAWRVEAYHKLASVDPGIPPFEAPQPALGLGNSLGALLAGRDDGFYYRSSGITLMREPRPEDRQWYRAAAFVDWHDDVRRKVEWNLASWLDRDRRFDPNIVADDGLFAGMSLMATPWWGLGTVQGGLELFGEGVAPEMEVDSTFARARLTGRAILPFLFGMRLGTEAALGHSWGTTPVQYDWFLGGATTVRGYDGGAMVGESMARARVELTRGNTAAGFALFADAGWAGVRDDFDTDDALFGAGVGFTLMDGLLRLDVARGFTGPTGWRIHFHLDALL